MRGEQCDFRYAGSNGREKRRQETQYDACALKICDLVGF